MFEKNLKEIIKQTLKKIDKHIEAILSECDEIDEGKEGQPPLVEMEEELIYSKAEK